MGKKNKEKIELSKISKNDLYFKDIFDKKLTITLYGEPIPASRPRRARGRYGMYVPHKKKMIKKLKRLYDEDELLQSITIPYPVGIVTKVYNKPKKKFQRKIGDERLEKEEVISLKRKDLDNYLKAHWDVLQYDEFQILLEDHHVCKSVTEKFYSNEPRIEMNILFSDHYQEDFFEKDVKSKVKYNKWMLSEKYLVNHNMDEKEFVEHFKDHIKNFSLNKESNVQDFLHQNLTKEQIDILISNICPELLTEEHVINYKSFASYIVETNGKFN